MKPSRHLQANAGAIKDESSSFSSRSSCVDGVVYMDLAFADARVPFSQVPPFKHGLSAQLSVFTEQWMPGFSGKPVF